jgi:hypothetical protein
MMMNEGKRTCQLQPQQNNKSSDAAARVLYIVLYNLVRTLFNISPSTSAGMKIVVAI